MSQSMRFTPEQHFQLLLTHAREHQPVLGEGLAAESSLKAPTPPSLPGRIEVPAWERPGAAPNDLAAQRWGVIAPEGPVGDSLLRAIAPLLEHREREQGGSEHAPVSRFRVPPDMNAGAAVKWKNEVLRAIRERERPRYLLLLGDLHHVSLELQQVLAHSGYVGRLHVGLPGGEPDLAGYTAYARKVVVHETRTDRDEAPELLLYTARDGTRATEAGYRMLVRPCLKELSGQWKVRELAPEHEYLEVLLGAAGAARAGVMLSVSHGLGRPRGKGWASPEEQRATQGALDLGAGQTLTAEQVRETPFLPGGMWFCVACFGAATPASSVFHTWMTRLAREGVHARSPQSVLWSLPREGERPFLAALPQALLANERGPLAIIGHADLAWVSSFSDPETPTRSEAGRILSSLETLAEGSRAGVALDALMRFYRDVNDQLMAGYEAREEAELFGGGNPTNPVRLGMLWMLRNDLRGYLLLGDPAARLPVKRAGL